MNARAIADLSRSLGGWLIGVAIVMLLLVPATALGSSESSLGVRMTRIATGKVTLVVRGGNVDSAPAVKYTTTASPLRIPCPGRYRYQAVTENQLSGASSSYTATISLSHLVGQPDRTPCGEVPPPRPGEVTVTIIGVSEIFGLTGSRGGSGGFLGSLYLRGVPNCDESYTFKTDLNLRGWHRSLSYRLEVDKVESTLEEVSHSTQICRG